MNEFEGERQDPTYDLFISYAHEDKEEVARPLVNLLKSLNLKVWFDEDELTIGAGLRRGLERGLAQSRFGVVILSPAYFRKEWPKKELDALIARESAGET
jgi:hypothetical protein